jgi:hypothetical protein
MLPFCDANDEFWQRDGSGCTGGIKDDEKSYAGSRNETHRCLILCYLQCPPVQRHIAVGLGDSTHPTSVLRRKLAGEHAY